MTDDYGDDYAEDDSYQSDDDINAVEEAASKAASGAVPTPAPTNENSIGATVLDTGSDQSPLDEQRISESEESLKRFREDTIASPTHCQHSSIEGF